MFVGREYELKQLDKFLRNEKQSVAVIYGRRRIGKSELIRRSLQKRNAFFFEGLENRPQKSQIANFILQLGRQVESLTANQTPKTWREAFFLLEKPLKKKPACIVLDEFQWMANYRREIVADLKMVWDQCLSSIPRVHLILCGSIASFMITKVIKSNALYGRTDLVVHLKSFCLAETKRLLHQKGIDEVIDAQMLLGGVPKYLELIGNWPSVHLAIEELAFCENGYFLDEYDRIFTSHFGKNRDYEKIVRVLVAHPYGLFRKELSKLTGIALGGRLSDMLSNLKSAGFITSVIPFDKGSASKTIKYFIHDAYLRFYFAFIQPNRKKIESAPPKGLFTRITQSGKFYAWRGRAFEFLCIDHAQKLAELLGFSAVDYLYGPYFRSASAKITGVQIDLLFDRADKVITLCEMKCSRTPLGKKIIEEIEKKVKILESFFPSKTIQRVLVVHGELTSTIKDSGYFYRIVKARELVK